MEHCIPEFRQVVGLPDLPRQRREIILDWGDCHRLLDELGIEPGEELLPRVHALMWWLVRTVNRPTRR